MRNRKPVILGVVLALMASVALYLLWPKPMVWHARTLVEAIRHRDVGTLYRYAYAEERAKEGLTPSNLRAVLDEFVGPRLARFHPEGALLSDTYARGAQGAATQLLRSGNATLEVNALPWQTDEGPRIGVLRTVLLLSWRAKFASDAGRDVRPDEMASVFLRSLEEDRARLQTLGLKGFVTESEQGAKFLTFDQVESNLRRQAVEPAKPVPAPDS